MPPRPRCRAPWRGPEHPGGVPHSPPGAPRHLATALQGVSGSTAPSWLWSVAWDPWPLSQAWPRPPARPCWHRAAASSLCPPPQALLARPPPRRERSVQLLHKDGPASPTPPPRWGAEPLHGQGPRDPPGRAAEARSPGAPAKGGCASCKALLSLCPVGLCRGRCWLDRSIPPSTARGPGVRAWVVLPQGCSRHVLPGTEQPPDLRARPMQCGWRWCRVGSAVRGPASLSGTAELLSGGSRAVCSACRVPGRTGSPRCLLPEPALGAALDRLPQRAGAGGGCGTLTGMCSTQRVLAPIWGSLLVVSCLLARPDWSSRCSRAGTTSGTGWQRSSELHPQPQPHQPRLSLSWKSVFQCRRCYRLPTCGSILHLPGSLCPTSGSRAGIVTPQSCPGMRAHCGAHRTRHHRHEAGGLWDHV